MREKTIPMVDLVAQDAAYITEIQEAVARVMSRGNFIQGEEVALFAKELAAYMQTETVPSLEVIPCANGTDALQVALMACDLRSGDEVIVPAFTYAATAEVVCLLGLTPVFVDVLPETFNLDPSQLEAALSPRVKAIMPVHLFGQSAPMNDILPWARQHHITVIEDNAQSLGATYDCRGKEVRVGTLGDVSCTSFFPTKNLGAYGDGGAIMTTDPERVTRLRMIANHGQRTKYFHECLGCNSRLDTLQAALLRVKLRYLDVFLDQRRAIADYYTQALSAVPELVLPKPETGRTYHQYTLRILGGRRDALKEYLGARNIASMIYYPTPLCDQPAFAPYARCVGKLPVARALAQEVLSLPLPLCAEQRRCVAEAIHDFFLHHA